MRFKRSNGEVTIRALTSKDYKSWHTTLMLLPDEPRNQFDTRVRPKSEDCTRQAFQKLLDRGRQRKSAGSDVYFAIFNRQGELVGQVLLMDITRGNFQNCYLGYFIYSPFWGRGYGSAAAKMAIDIAFRELKLHRVEAAINPRNKRSLQLAKSIGMRREGLSRRRLLVRGGGPWNDMVLYALTCEDVGITWKGS